MKTTEFPKTIKRGSVSVTIYETPTKDYPGYTLVYYQDGKRKRETSSDPVAIVNRAEEVLGDIESGRIESVALSGGERETFARAMKALSATGQPLDVAVSHYAQAFAILGDDLVIEAAREYDRRHKGVTSKLVRDVVAEFLASREGASVRHLETLSGHCNRFAAGHSMHIEAVTTSDVETFLTGLNATRRTRKNYLGSLANLFRFAAQKKYLPRDYDELSLVQKPKAEKVDPEIYTPDELTRLMKVADRELLPFLAIGAFAGLRSSEIERLDWQEVKFESGNIVVKEGKVNKGRRLVPLLPNLIAILKPLARAAGPIWPHGHQYLHERIREAAKAAKVEIKNNGLRHSFVSYRVAQIKNCPQTALECGNSPRMIQTNYLELVTEQQAKEWFSIVVKAKPAQKVKAALLKAA
jgi:integrase